MTQKGHLEEKLDARFEELSDIKKCVFVCSTILLVTTFITFFPVIILIVTQSFVFAGLATALLFAAIQVIFFVNQSAFDREDWLIACGFAFPPTSYFTMYHILEDDSEILSCLFNRNGINWFMFNIWRAMSSKYMKVETADITKYEGFQLLEIYDFDTYVTMHVRVRNDNEEAMLILLQD